MFKQNNQLKNFFLIEIFYDSNKKIISTKNNIKILKIIKYNKILKY